MRWLRNPSTSARRTSQIPVQTQTNMIDNRIIILDIMGLVLIRFRKDLLPMQKAHQSMFVPKADSGQVPSLRREPSRPLLLLAFQLRLRRGGSTCYSSVPKQLV